MKVKINTKYNVSTQIHENPPTVLINQAGGSGSGIKKLTELHDVDASNLVDGSVIVYSEAEDKFKMTTALEQQTINGGHF